MPVSPRSADLRPPLKSFGWASLALLVVFVLNPSRPLDEADLAATEWAKNGEFAATEDEPPVSDPSPEIASPPTESEFADAPPAPAAPAEISEPPEPPWLQYRIRRGDTIASILDKIPADDAARDFLLAQKFKSYRKMRLGDHLDFKLGPDQRLLALRYKTSPEYYLRAHRGEDGTWSASEEPPHKITRTLAAGGRIDSSLFAAADSANLSESAVNLLINALETRIDFYRDVRRGDSFRVIYTEERDEDGEVVGPASLLAIEYESLRGREPLTIRAAAAGDSGKYYTPDGESLHGAFLRAPLKFRRISSRFTGRRFHPVLKVWRPHRGVDYAAPTGTKVRATADGVVTKVARERGYGNVVMIRHYRIYTTVYGHLNKFAKGMRKGLEVKQGQVIGYVGQTGLSTGPHLHYEFRVRGKHKDPLSQSVPQAVPPLAGEELARFRTGAAPLFAALDEVWVPALQEQAAAR